MNLERRSTMKKFLSTKLKWIISVASFVFSAIISCAFDWFLKEFCQKFILPLALLSAACLSTFWIAEYIFRKEADDAIAAKDETISKLRGKKVRDQGTSYLELALCSGLRNNVRYSLLEKSAKCGNVYASVLLAFAYIDGVDNLVKVDYKKAYHILTDVVDMDSSGMVDWLLGWIHEQGYLNKKDYLAAEKHYMKSLGFGYAKAYNSMGKFRDRGYNGNNDSLKAATYYVTAAEKGDINAMLNAAFFHEEHLKQYDNAKKYYQQAIDNGSQLGKMRLAKLYMDEYGYFSSTAEISSQDIADLFMDAINSQALSKEEKACCYYWLAKLVSNNPEIDIGEEVATSSRLQSCLLAAYNELYEINKTQDIKGRMANEIWNTLLNSSIFSL